MLVLTRRPGQSVTIPSLGVTITVQGAGRQVRLAFDAPRDVKIARGELVERPTPAKGAAPAGRPAGVAGGSVLALA